jgi:ubiquinone/menaquinone biosynthesis C-methylase UbiE
MAEINLLSRYPKSKRDLSQRNTAQSKENIKIAREYGKEYFDGSRDTGYGGYFFDDRRWKPVAIDIANHFNLHYGSQTLDIGCAKGFLVHELLVLHKDAYGIDISDYAVRNCHPSVVGRIHLGNCVELPFPDNSFHAVTAINVVHNLERDECIQAIKEIQRVSGGRAYIQVDSYRNMEERRKFLAWVLTAKTHLWPGEWQALFSEAGYTGDFFWTIVE